MALTQIRHASSIAPSRLSVNPARDFHHKWPYEDDLRRKLGEKSIQWGGRPVRAGAAPHFVTFPG